MFTTLTEKEIKALIDEHRKTISKMERQRSLIAFLVLLTLISVFLLSIVGNILLTIFSFIIGSLVILFLVGIFPRQSNTEQLEYEIEEELIFSDRFYKYSPFELSDVDFVPEVDNQFDPNAVKIVVRGYHLGYVTKSKSRKVLRLTTDSNNEIVKIAKIYGGDYKDIDPESDKLRTVKDSFKIQINLKVLKK